MTLSARSADLRGNEYQYIRAWRYAVVGSYKPGFRSLSVEEKEGGAFDDVVVRWDDGATDYEQAKTSNFGNTVIDDAWLITARTANGKSPLQHFFRTWSSLTASGLSFDLTIVTNRGVDVNHPVLETRDLMSGHLAADRLVGPPNGKLALKLRDWEQHLDTDAETLVAFLSSLRVETTGTMDSILEELAVAHRAAGLRDDEQALQLGISFVRDWVMRGAGEQTREQIWDQIVRARLLIPNVELTLAVSSIDSYETAREPHVRLDFTQLYDQSLSPWSRREIAVEAIWSSDILPQLAAAESRLARFGSKSLHVQGHMRLPMWFAVGRAFPSVRGWKLSTVQTGDSWALHPARDVGDDLRQHLVEGSSGELVVAVSLSNDMIGDATRWAEVAGLETASILHLSPQVEPSLSAVPDGEWMSGWARKAREAVQAASRGRTRAHLLMSAPSSGALALGHHWNVMLPTTVYEYDPTSQSYVSCFTSA